jgi:hypothetical protein
MVPLASLWLPILLAAVIVFIASSIMHMVLPYHHSDYKQIPEEEKVMAPLGALKLPPGVYVVPFCTHKTMKLPETQEKYKKGPVGILTLYPNQQPAMGKFMGLWFVFCLIIAFFTAYLTGHTVARGSEYLVVFRVAGTAAFMGYGLGMLSNGIWKGQPWSNVIKEVIDGLIYGLLTAGTFGWLWPR